MTEPIIVAIDPRQEDAAPAALGALFARLFGDVPVRTIAVPNGASPARTLRAQAEREGAQLLVIGSSRRGPAGRVLPAAVTDRLLHAAPCPVAVAPPDFTPAPLELIGAAYIDRPDGRAALAFAEDVAARADASVQVLSVAEPPPARIDATLEPLAHDYVRLAREEAAKMALEEGTRALSDDRSAGGRLLSGPAADALARASEELDLLVCGSRGYGPVRSVLLGTTSHALVRRAACPVVVVPVPEHHDRR